MVSSPCLVASGTKLSNCPFKIDGEKEMGGKKMGRNSAEDDKQFTEYRWEEIGLLGMTGHHKKKDLSVVLHGGNKYKALQEEAGRDCSEELENRLHREGERERTKKYFIGKVRRAVLGDLFKEIDLFGNRNAFENGNKNRNKLNWLGIGGGILI